MLVDEAQREVRTVFLGGLVGCIVSGTLWLVSAALGTWGTRRAAILALVVGGIFIYPAMQLVLKAMGRRASLSAGNPLGGLALQIALTIPLSLPLIFAATAHRTEWFYPAFMIVVGAHYLPFVFLYGMWMPAVLGALLLGGGTLLLNRSVGAFATGAWFTGFTILAFGFIGYAIVRREQRGA